MSTSKNPTSATPLTAEGLETSRPIEFAAGADRSPLEALLDAPSRPFPSTDRPFVALCTDTRHPTLSGRVRIRREGAAESAADPLQPERWVPTLHGFSIRVGDRLLMQAVEGHSEPIVIGVIDGFCPRPEPLRQPGPRVALQRDEVLLVQSADGQNLLEVVQDERGPIVRLLGDSTRLELSGKLSITAAELELKANNGSARIEATDAVQLVGEIINLN